MLDDTKRRGAYISETELFKMSMVHQKLQRGESITRKQQKLILDTPWKEIIFM